MDKKLVEIGKLIVDDSLKLLDESDRKQREIQLQFEKKQQNLLRWGWILMIALTTIIGIVAWLVIK